MLKIWNEVIEVDMERQGTDAFPLLFSERLNNHLKMFWNRSTFDEFPDFGFRILLIPTIATRVASTPFIMGFKIRFKTATTFSQFHQNYFFPFLRNFFFIFHQ
jgi:hypothetical protein